MGDYKPEIVYENAGVVEIDPRDDASDCGAQRIATTPKLVTVARRSRSAGDRRVSPARRAGSMRGIRFC